MVARCSQEQAYLSTFVSNNKKLVHTPSIWFVDYNHGVKNPCYNIEAMAVYLVFLQAVSLSQQLILWKMLPSLIPNLLINNINLVASYTDIDVTFQSLRNILSVIFCGEIHGGSVNSAENYTMSVVKTSTARLPSATYNTAPKLDATEVQKCILITETVWPTIHTPKCSRNYITDWRQR